MDNAPASEWIRDNAAGYRSWYLLGVEMLARASFTRVVEALPWRQRADMERAVPQLVALATSRARDGVEDPVLHGIADAVLPLPSRSDTVVDSEVLVYLGHEPRSLLECYEALYAIGEGAIYAATRDLIHELFCEKVAD